MTLTSVIQYLVAYTFAEFSGVLIQKNSIVIENFAQAFARGHEVQLCPMVYYEVYRGLLHKDRKNLLPYFLKLMDSMAISSLAQEDWTYAAVLWAETRGAGKTVDEMDLLIAAYAKRRHATVVTNNEKHFTPLGVPVENWLHKKEWLQKND